MELLHTIVQQGKAPNPLTPLALLASRFYPAWTLLRLLKAVLIATSRELKRHPSFKLLASTMIRGLQKIPI